jgi:hypothetical protein
LNSEIRNLVIGTGPSGYASITALIEKGAKPTVVDIGTTKSAKEAGYLASLKSTHELKSNAGEIFMYNYPTEGIDFSELNHAIALSSALGGLSNIWAGGWQLPCRETIGQMPDNTFKEIEQSALRLISRLEHTGIQDGLSKIQSLNVSDGLKIDTSQRIQRITRLFQRIERRDNFEIQFGQPRLLLRANQTDKLRARNLDPTRPDAQELIFNSREVIAELIKEGKIEYIKGRVTKVVKEGDKLNVVIVLANSKTQTLSARKVFLGAGSIGTPLILQNSFENLNEIRIRDSQMFQIAYLCPWKSNWKGRKYSFPEGYFQSTTQLAEFSCSVLENSKQLAERLYSASKELGLGKSRIFSNLLAPFLMAGIGFIPVEKSGEIVVRFENGNSKITTVQNPLTSKAIKQSIRQLRWLCLRMGILVIGYKNQIPRVGAGFHSGSAFPMSEASGGLTTTNLLGEFSFCPNLHIIDSSSLPRIMTGSHTLIAMANADRIARQAGDF